MMLDVNSVINRHNKALQVDIDKALFKDQVLQQHQSLTHYRVIPFSNIGQITTNQLTNS